MVAWISSIPGRRRVALFGAVVGGIGVVLAMIEPRAGWVVAALGIAIVLWAFFHRPLSGYGAYSPAPSSDDLVCGWRRAGGDARNPIILISYSGLYPEGSAGNGVAARMTRFAREAIRESQARAVIFDLFDLRYTWGDAIGGLAIALTEGQQDFRPAVIVADGTTASSLAPLMTPNTAFGLARLTIVRTGDEALRVLEQALASSSD